ncbi:MAG: peptidylprolyl isomerase, partial [Steroidobacteraceae bacterium]
GEFMTDETITLEYIELKRDEIPAQPPASEQDLLKFYAENVERYKQPERRRARHILISVTRPEGDAAALKKANEIFEKLKGGGDFTALAKQYSDDATTQSAGGDLDWRAAGGLEPPVDQAVFSMQVNELHAPVKSRFGYHILRLDAVEPAKQKSFSEVRADLEPEYRAKSAERAFGDRQSQLEDLAFSRSGGDFKSLAATMKLEIKSIPNFSRTNGGGALGANKAILDAAFSDDVLNGGNSEPKEVAPGDIVVLHATAHKSAEPRPLAEVKAGIVSRLKNDGARKEARAAGDALIAKLKAGAVWDQALSADHHVPTPRQYIARTDQSLATPLKEALFAAPRPKAGQVEYRGVEVNDGGYAVYAFSGVRDGSPGEAVEKRSGRVRELAARFGNGDFAAYAAEVERTADIERNLKAIE